MRRMAWLVAVLVLAFCAGETFAKGEKPAKKANAKAAKEAQDAAKIKATAEKNAKLAVVGPTKTISGTIKMDGDTVKMIADDKAEYTVDSTTKYQNGQKVKITGEVTEIGGEKWIIVGAK